MAQPADGHLNRGDEPELRYQNSVLISSRSCVRLAPEESRSSCAIQASYLALSSRNLAVSSTMSTVPLKAEINQESR